MYYIFLYIIYYIFIYYIIYIIYYIYSFMLYIMHVYMYECMYVCVYECTCVHVHVHACVYVYVWEWWDITQAVEHSHVKVAIIQSSLHGRCICSLGVFSVPTSGPELIHQRLWYVLSRLLESAYKRSLVAYQKGYM